MGQRNVVAVYTLVARDTVEERLLEIARKKRLLEHMVIENVEETLDAPQLDLLLQESSAKLFSEHAAEIIYDDATLEQILDRSEATTDVKRAPSAAAAVADAPAADGSGAPAPADEDHPLSFKFARVWEKTSSTAGNGEVAAAPTATAGSDDFWANLLKDEFALIKEEEKRKAEQYGKGKRTRSTVARMGSSASSAKGPKVC